MNGSYQFEKLENRFNEAALLEERAQLRLEGFTDLLIRHGFPPNGKILEVGAAQGIRTRRMAEKFPSAQVTGIDRSVELLQFAKQRHADVKNLNFLQADLFELPFPADSFDFIYVRLVFMHLKDPVGALKSLQRVLRPGGRILIEDADRDCMFIEPEPPSFADFWEKAQEAQRRAGGNPNVGRMLAPLLKEAGFQNLNIEPQPTVGGSKEIEFLVRTLMPSLNCYLNPEERVVGEKAMQDLLKLCQDPRVTFYHFWFSVSGQKHA